jgi:hypothetical protein
MRYWLLLALATTISFSRLSHGSEFGELRPFTTDGCSHFPDGTLENPTQWQSCCVTHDFRYWMGGTRAERLDADRELRACVAKTGEPVVAELMFAGVRLGGSAQLPTPFRWGYGWSELRGYAPVTSEEWSEIRSLAPEDLSSVPITHCD